MGLVFPPDFAFFRRFNVALLQIGDKKEVVLDSGHSFIECHTPIVPLCPGGEIALKDCLFVPENWTTGLGAGYFEGLKT